MRRNFMRGRKVSPAAVDREVEMKFFIFQEMRNEKKNFAEVGPCRTKTCTNTGRRARGAKDIEPMAARTGVFEKSFYCDDCLSAGAQRALVKMKGTTHVSPGQ